MRAKVIEPCVYDNEFRKVDEVVEGTQEDLQTHIDFGYVEVLEKAENAETKEPEPGAKEPEPGAKEPEPGAVDAETDEVKTKPSKSRKK